MKKRVLVFTMLFFLFSIIVFLYNYDVILGTENKIDYVPDEKTAIKVAEAIWLPIFGNVIYEEKPFRAILYKNKVWKVYGTIHAEVGGVAYIEIRKSDCKILEVTHGL